MINLFTRLRLEELEAETRDYLEDVAQKDPDAVFSSSGGADSEVIFAIIKKYSIPIKNIFFNKEVENPNNRKRLNIQSKYFENVYSAKTVYFNTIGETAPILSPPNIPQQTSCQTKAFLLSF